MWSSTKIFVNTIEWLFSSLDVLVTDEILVKIEQVIDFFEVDGGEIEGEGVMDADHSTTTKDQAHNGWE